MFGLLLFSLLAAAAFAASPLHQAKHYAIYRLADVDVARTSLLAPKETFEVVNGTPRTSVTYPYGDNVAEDSGGNFGDMEISITVKNGTLVARETIVNDVFEDNVLVSYSRTFPGYYIEDLRAYNVGRERGATRYGHISHELGFVEAEIVIAAGNEIRIFVEVYAREEE